MAVAGLKVFFSYFGGKWRAAPHYPSPIFDHIIEPFAGAAGYALRYADRKVTLIDKDPIIAGIWTYLTRVSADEVLRLPVSFQHIDELPACVPQEARWLMGFWLNKGTVAPCKSPSYWMRKSCGKDSSYKTGGSGPSNWWGAEIRLRIASQLAAIRHWTVIHGSYEEAPQKLEATWYVDPPYEVAGQKYRMRDVNYTVLASWCKAQRGQVIVCENDGATWLPFQPFRSIKATPGKQKEGQRSVEVLWTNLALPANTVALSRTREAEQAMTVMEDF